MNNSEDVEAYVKQAALAKHSQIAQLGLWARERKDECHSSK